MNNQQAFGIYIHIPFCEKKCSYCDFYSIERTGEIEKFVNLLLKEITLSSANRDHNLLPPATSIFFGGGTPSLLSIEQLSRILNAVQAHHTIASDVEISMECNPGTVTLDTLRGYRECGVNRLSFGVQSFNTVELTFLNRIHSPEQAVSAIALAHDSGFSNINLDLMFCVPGQTLSTLSESLDIALKLNTQHIAAYSLIYEEGTPLFRQKQLGLVTPVAEETDAEMYELVISRLTNAGYKQYEVSNFALDGYECRHNLSYWNSLNYIAYGPSAHGYLSNTRYWNHRNITKWGVAVANDELPISNSESISPSDRLQEYVFLALRSTGLVRKELASITSEETLQSVVQYCNQNQEFFNVDNDRIALSARGYGICDSITIDLLQLIDCSTAVVPV